MGASWVGERADEMPGKADSAIIFAPAGNLVPVALTHLRKGGTLALAGIYMTAIPQLQYEQHVFFERDIRSVTANTRADGRELLEEASRIPIRPQTTTFSLKQTNEALQALKADRLDGSGVIVIGSP
jgi:propanol-preferring alcohol dehydrogenase